MSKVLLGIVIGVFALYAYQRVHQSSVEAPDSLDEPELKFAEQSAAPAVERHDNEDRSRPSFSCDGRQHCSQMKSCDEAEYFLAHCPDVKMDGDRDGRPCEDMCGH